MPGISLHTELAPAGPRQAHSAPSPRRRHGNYSGLGPWRRPGRIASGIASGYDADLVTLDADPTVDIGNAKRIRTVVLKGLEIEREGLLSTASE